MFDSAVHLSTSRHHGPPDLTTADQCHWFRAEACRLQRRAAEKSPAPSFGTVTTTGHRPRSDHPVAMITVSVLPRSKRRTNSTSRLPTVSMRLSVMLKTHFRARASIPYATRERFQRLSPRPNLAIQSPCSSSPDSDVQIKMHDGFWPPDSLSFLQAIPERKQHCVRRGTFSLSQIRVSKPALAHQ